MNFQNHSCLLPQRTSDIRNLEERKGLWMGDRVGKAKMRKRRRRRRGWYGQERDDENQI